MVFNSKELTAMEEALGGLFRRLVDILHPQFTREEFFLLFVPEADREVLRRAAEVGVDNNMLNTCYAHWDFPGQLTITLNKAGDNQSRLAPRYPRLQNDAPAELVQKMKAWVDMRVEIGTDFARANSVLHHLSDICETSTQLRYAWPSVVALARMHEATSKLAAEITQFRQPRTAPSISYELRGAIRKASATVASALLVSEDTPIVTPEVTIKPSHPLVVEPPLRFTPW